MPSAPPTVAPSSSDPSSLSQGSSSQSSTGKGLRRKKVASEAADLLIATRIAESCNALWWGELIRHSLKLVLGIVVAVGVWVLLDHWVLSRPSVSGINWAARIASLVGLVIAVASYVFFRIVPLIGHSISPEYAARSLERNYPNLRQSLTSYITLKDDASQAGLQGRVVQSIGASTAGYLKQHDELPEEATGNMKLWVSTAAALAMLVFYAAASPKNSLQSVRRLITPTASIAPVTRVSIGVVTPGDAEAIAGRTIKVTAEIRGLRGEEKAVCEIQYAAGAKQVALRKDDTVGANALSADITLDHSASGELPYRIIAGDAASPNYRFLVKDVPVVALDSLNYLPPAYTGTGPFTRTTGAISAIQGTTITLKAATNRPIARAAIEFNPKPVGDTIRATDGAVEMSVGEDGRSLSVNFTLQIDQRRSASVRRDSYRIRVWDDSGVSNPDPIIYPIDIIADLPPEIAIMLPTRVPKDVPIGTQQIIEVHASDADFGLVEIRLQMKNGIRSIGEPVLWKDLVGKRGNQVAEYRFRPSEIGVSVGDTVRIIAIATDNKTGQAKNQAKGNTTETDPIELTIVDADQMPPSEDADGEGLSESDDQPASDPESSQQDSSEGSGDDTGDGEQQQGGGGAKGEQGSGQSGESGEQGSGGGKGDQSQQNEGESQGEGGQPGGEGQEKGESQGNQTSSGDQGEGEPSDGEGESGEGEPMQGEPSQGEPSQGEPGKGEPGEGQAGEGEQPEGSPEGSPESNPEQNGASGGSDASGQSDEQSAPKHDGEAFERIQEYLDQKRKEEGGDQGGQKGEPSDSGEPSQGQSADGQPSADDSNDGSQGEGNEPQGNESQGSESQGNQSQGNQSQPNQSQGSKGEQGQESESSSGDQGSEGMSETDSSEAGSKDSSGEPESGQGDQAEGSSEGPEKGDSEKGDSEKGNSEQGKPEQGQGDQGDGQQGSSEQGSSEQGSSEPSSKDQGTGDQESGKQGDASEQGADTASGESDQASSDQAKGEPKEGQPGAESEAGNSDQTGSPAEDDSATQARSPKPSSQGRPGSGDGSGESDDTASPPKPSQTQAANDDYARKATDMVLDYLDQTRDAPDQELLDRLNWTQQDLQRFQDRWKDIGDLEGAKNGNDPTANRATEEALRSLGLRPSSTGRNLRNGEQADSLKGIRDSGNRRRPPAALRDAFDAFRRQMGNGN